ncbi:MAG: YcjF family protein [Oceanibaculum sp.]
MATKSTDSGASADTKAASVAADTDGVARALSGESKIKTYVIASVTASIVPVPLFDIAAVTAIQLRMIQKLSQLYGTPFSESAVRNVITALAGGVLGYGVGAAVAISLTKAIPGVGWMLGMVSMPAIAGGSTYAIGRAYLKHFEEGGSVFDFDVESMRSYYDEQFEKGKKLAAKVKAEARKRSAEADFEEAPAA